MIETIQDFFFIFQDTLMVRGLTVNQVYGVKSYGGSSPSLGAKLLSCGGIGKRTALLMQHFGL